MEPNSMEQHIRDYYSPWFSELDLCVPDEFKVVSGIASPRAILLHSITIEFESRRDEHTIIYDQETFNLKPIIRDNVVSAVAGYSAKTNTLYCFLIKGN